MSIYGKAAVHAANLCCSGVAPVDAWQRAISAQTGSASVRKKVCPRESFLGLVARGDLAEIPAQGLGTDGRNRRYATDAVDHLRDTPRLDFTPQALWHQVAGAGIRHNGQMNVVLALWHAGRVNNSQTARAVKTRRD